MTNKLVIFQTTTNNIFWDLIGEHIIIVYLNDTHIFTQILEEHYQVVYRVLEVPAEHKVFLYKPYAILLLLEPSRLLTLEPTLLKEVNNLEKALKTLHSSMKTILFLPLTHYKSIWPDGEKIQYWNEIMAEFNKSITQILVMKGFQSKCIQEDHYTVMIYL